MQEGNLLGPGDSRRFVSQFSNVYLFILSTYSNNLYDELTVSACEALSSNSSTTTKK
jgi:hypothetical protein